MKLIKHLSLAAMFIANMFADSHFPTVSLHTNPNEKDTSHLKLSHQMSIMSDRNDLLMVHTSYMPHLDNSHQLDWVLGARKFTGRHGFGVNFGYATSNQPGFFAHQFSPGFEWIYHDFQLSFNQYIPVKTMVRNKDLITYFPLISEVGLHYRPTNKYEFGVIPFYDHLRGELGVNGKLSAFITNSIELDARPFWRPQQKGISFSIGVHFGGSKDKKNQEIRKTNVFNYIQEKSLPKPLTPIKVTITPVAMPIASEPDNTPMKPDVPEEPKMVVIPPSAPVEPPKPKGWLDFFFPRSRISRSL